MQIQISTFNRDQLIVSRDYELDTDITPDQAYELLADIIEDSYNYISEEARGEGESPEPTEDEMEENNHNIEININNN